METILFDKYGADYSPKGVDGSRLLTVQNVIPYDGKYNNLLGPSNVTAASAGGQPRNIFEVQDSDGTVKQFLASNTKIERVNGATLTDVTRVSGTYNQWSDDNWDWARFGDWLILTHYTHSSGTHDPPQKLTDITSGSNFADFSGTVPVGKTCASYNNQFWQGWVYSGATEYPLGVYRSAVGDPEDHTASNTTGAGSDTIQAPGEQIVALRTLGDRLLCYLDNSIWVITATGDNRQWFTYERIWQGDGPVGKHAVIQLDNSRHLFLGRFDVYIVDGLLVRPLNAPIKSSVIKNIGTAYYQRHTSAINKQYKYVMWPWLTSGQSSDYFLIYNYAEERFAITANQAIQTYCIGSFGLFKPGTASIATVGTDEKIYTLTGNSLAGTIQTAEYDFDRMVTITKTMPMIESPSATVTVNVYTRDHDDDTYTTTSATMDSDGMAYLHATGRYVKFEIVTTAADTHTGIRGIKYLAVPRGKR